MALTQTHTHAQTQTDKRDSGYNLQFSLCCRLFVFAFLQSNRFSASQVR